MPTPRTPFWLVAAVILSITAARTGLAADAPESPAADEQVPAGAKIDELIRQLDDASFAKRQDASAELAKRGKDVIPALEQAAQGDSREATTRSIDLLKKFYETGDEATKVAAKEALTRLSTCKKPSAASRAQAALKPKPKPQPGVIPWGVPGGGIQIGGGQIQIQIQAQAGGNGKKISIKNVNGNKEIEVEEKDRKVKINEDPNGKIKMEVTEKDEKGKQKTSKYEAKNADELKKKHPEAHKIYQQYSKGNAGGIRIHAIQAQPGGAIPIPIQPPGVPRMIPFKRPLNRDAAKRIEEAAKQIEQIRKDMEKSAENTEQLKKRLEQLEKVRQQLEETRKKLDENGRAAG